MAWQDITKAAVAVLSALKLLHLQDVYLER
jgi:hypothetical protein